MPEKQSKSLRSLLLTVLKVGVVVCALAYLKYSGKFDLKKLNFDFEIWHLLAAGFLLQLVANLISFVRYRLLLKGVGIDMNLKTVTHIGMIGVFFNTFMLGGLGGDVIKLAYVIRESGNRAGAVASVMVDRVLGLLGLLFLGGAALFLNWREVLATPSLHNLSLGVFGVLGGTSFGVLISMISLVKGRKWGAVAWGAGVLATAGFCLLALHDDPVALFASTEVDAADVLRGRALLVLAIVALLGFACMLVVPSCQPGRTLENFLRNRVPLGGKLMELVKAVLAYRSHFLIVVRSFALSAGLQALVLLSLFCFSQTIAGVNKPTLGQVFFAGPPTFVANALPMPGGGLGVGENAFEYLLGRCQSSGGKAVEGGALIFLMWRFWTIIMGLCGLPFYLWGKKAVSDAREAYTSE